jgi:three-Cys-motif partner protein
MLQSPYEDREQTAVKHRVLERYLSAFVPIVGDWASDIAYIDCLAGPWESVDPKLRDTSFARAIEVLRSTRKVLSSRDKSPTMRCLFIEKEPEAFGKLKRYCDGVLDIEVTPQNWDLTSHISDVVKFAKDRSKSFPFIFIDPKGWEPLATSLISPILSLDPGEVLITLMTSFITRFLADETKGFDRIFRCRLTKTGPAARRRSGRGSCEIVCKVGARRRTVSLCLHPTGNETRSGRISFSHDLRHATHERR